MKAVELNNLLSSKNATWIAKENPISQLNPDQQRQLLGAMPPKVLAQAAPFQTSLTNVSLPVSVDWRNNNGNFVSSVKNQGGCGSCVAFGSTAAAEAIYAIEYGNGLTDFSEADSFFCSSHGAVCTGWWPADFFQANESRGLVNEVLFPYASAFPNNNTSQSPPSCVVIPNRKVSEFTYNNIQTTTGLDDAKVFLTVNGPMAACFTVYQDFFNYSSGVYTHQSGSVAGGHCVCVIGFCDDSSIPGGGYWICKNSWGAGWGMSGFFNIAYGQCDIDVNQKLSVMGISIPVFNSAVIDIMIAALTCQGNTPKQTVLVNGWRTLAQLNQMSEDDIRNTLIVELSKCSTDTVPVLQGETNSQLAANGFIYYFLLADGYTAPALAAMSLDNQRNTMIVILNKLLGTAIPDLQALHNSQLVNLLIASTGGSKTAKSVQINGWRTATELESMSDDDIRNTIIVELSNRSTDTVPALQAETNQQLSAHGLIYYFLVLSGYTPASLAAMSLDDQRNTFIVIVNKLTGASIPSLQALDNSQLLSFLMDWPN